MDIKEYIKIIRKNAFFIVALTLIGALVAFYSTRFLSSGYKNEMVYFLTVSTQDKSGLNQRLDPTNITDTAVAILTSPDFLNETSITPLSIDAKKLAPQVIRLTLTSDDPGLSANSQDSVVGKFNQKITTLVPETSLKLQSVGANSQSVHDVLNNKILAVFGAMVGLLASLIIITIVRYLRL
jgi:capsular polysaccharide biosynthesis protein